MQATVLSTHADVDSAPPGLYVVRSDHPAYFPALALIEVGIAAFRGESFDAHGRVVTLEVLKAPPTSLGADDDIFSRRQITVGRQFFINALKDYRDWPEKWWREVVQNSVDAGATRIDLTCIDTSEGVEVTCADNGAGMDAETVMNKFLVLGETTKTAGGNVAGGFGKAKEMILLPWISWRIHSRDVLVEGAGDQITSAGRTTARTGTQLTVIMSRELTTTGAAAISFIEKCFLPSIKFTVNGKTIKADLAPGQVLSATEDVSVHYAIAKVRQPWLYVRTRGLYMFSVYIGEVPGYIVAELLAPSVRALTANRDGFRDHNISNVVSRLGERVAKDTMSALRSKQGMVRKKYIGTGKFQAKRVAAQLLDTVSGGGSKLSENDTQAIVDVVARYEQDPDVEKPELIGMPPAEVVTTLIGKVQGALAIEAALRQLAWTPDFYLINEIEGWRVPKKFFPETMTPTILKLAKTWVELCRYVLIQLKSDVEFGVGFVFSDHMGAACVTDEDNVGWLMLNPMTGGRVLRPTIDSDLKWMYASAIHEATHMADGIQYHDESFAAALTRNIARCADGYRHIKKIAAGIKMR